MMTTEQLNALTEFRKKFKAQITQWQEQYPDVDFVYNTALDNLSEENEISYILVGDNPGIAEKEQGKYFVSKAGLAIRKFMHETTQGQVNFDDEVITLHKSPIATAKTTDLKTIPQAIVDETQKWMAEHLVELHQELGCWLWIIGISQMKEGGVFAAFKEAFDANWVDKEDELFVQKVLLFRHFSNECFINDFIEMRHGTDGVIYSEYDEETDTWEDYDTPLSFEELLEEEILDDYEFLEKWLGKLNGDVDEENDDLVYDEFDLAASPCSYEECLRLVGGFHRGRVLGDGSGTYQWFGDYF